MIAIPAEQWRVFQNITFTELSQIFKHLAGLVKLRPFRLHPLLLSLSKTNLVQEQAPCLNRTDSSPKNTENLYTLKGLGGEDLLSWEFDNGKPEVFYCLHYL
jgi:hypothetical protein